MHIGIIGLPQSGKKTLFTLLTQGRLSAQAGSGKQSKNHELGISQVSDKRLTKLAALYNPKKLTPAIINYVLVPAVTQNSDENRTVFRSISTADALCIIVRAFEDDTVFHIQTTIDPKRDLLALEHELLLNDLIFTESRIAVLEKNIKAKNEAQAIQELKLMQQINEHLNKELPLRLFTFTSEEQKIINAYPFLTTKKIIVALNVHENNLTSNTILDSFKQLSIDRGLTCIQVSCKIEKELEEIEDQETKQDFLSDLGITESALDRLTQECYRSLNLISFFTVGPDEVRAWTIKKGTLAAQAGGVIHSDIERGFIRAEHMRVEDLLSLESEAKVKEQGKFSLKGKEHIVEDGDILHFRFNV